MRRDARNREERLPRGTVIYLNDKPVRQCVVVDDDEGFIERWRMDDQGRIPYPTLLIREYGTVRIEIPEQSG
jgi:hypothetical protein